MLENALSVAHALGEVFVNPILERTDELSLFQLIDDDQSLLPEVCA